MMEGRFFKHRSTSSAVDKNMESFPGLQSPAPTSASQFATGLRQMLGEDGQPDALFFVESWTLSVPQALENLRQRQSEQQAGISAHEAEYHSVDNAGSAAFVQQAQWRNQPRTQSSPQPCAAAMAGFASVEASLPQDRVHHAGYTANEYCREPANQQMTAQRAWSLLGVAANSTRAQIRSAYRRMVSRWHPDRHEHTSDVARQAANEKMAAINEAYRLLRSELT